MACVDGACKNSAWEEVELHLIDDDAVGRVPVGGGILMQVDCISAVTSCKVPEGGLGIGRIRFKIHPQV